MGKGLFGRSLRLRVALWALSREAFFQSEAVVGVDYSASGVSAELDRLVDLGMLQRFIGAGDRRVWYSRTDSALWGIIDAAKRAVEMLDHAPEELS